jgi:hypothetical protein
MEQRLENHADLLPGAFDPYVRCGRACVGVREAEDFEEIVEPPLASEVTASGLTLPARASVVL